MKKIIFSFLSISVIIQSVNAQVAKGLMTVGGDLSIQNTSFSGGGSSNSTSFSPSFAYFLSDKIAVGGALGITSNSTTGSATTTTTSVTPFIRYYKFTSEEKFGFFAQGGIGFSSTTGQSTVVTVSVRPGFVYFFTPKWGLDFTLPGLAYASGNNTTTFGITASLVPSLGFRYYFGR